MKETKAVNITNGITEGVIWKQLLLFFFPILFGTFFQQLYNTVDAIIVGRFVGKEALAAVGGTTATLINLLVGFFVGLSSGASVIISQYYGAGRRDKVQDAIHTSVALSIVGGLILMAAGILLSPWAMRAMGNPEELMPHSLTYIRIYFGGVIFNLLYNMGSGILRAVGDSKRPLYYLIAACAANIILDVLFVVILRWEVFGVAAATVLSQVISAVLVIYTLVKTKECYQLDWTKVGFTRSAFQGIIRIGLPAGLQSVMYAFSNIIIQASVNSFGTNTIAVWTAFGKIDSLFWMMIGAFGVAITTFAGQNYGAGKNERVKKGVRDCMKIAMGASIGLSIIICLIGQYFYRLFTTDPKVIEIGMEMLYFIVPTFFTYVAIEVLSGALRGVGDSFIPMVVTCLGVCVLRIFWVAAAVPLWHNIKTVMFCYPLTWVVTSILFLVYYRNYSKKNLN